ncbi:hypothetical protein [Exiguobacterium sp. s193]|nr:hypothetical protein [Exiguobacterium sp. s193]
MQKHKKKQIVFFHIPDTSYLVDRIDFLNDQVAGDFREEDLNL